MSGAYYAYLNVSSFEEVFADFPAVQASLTPNDLERNNLFGQRALPISGYGGFIQAEAYHKDNRDFNTYYAQPPYTGGAVLRGFLRYESAGFLRGSLVGVDMYTGHVPDSDQMSLLMAEASGAKLSNHKDFGEYHDNFKPLRQYAPAFSLQAVPDIKPTTLEFIHPKVLQLFGKKDICSEPFLGQYQDVLAERAKHLKDYLKALEMAPGVRYTNNQIYAKIFELFDLQTHIGVRKAAAFLHEFRNNVIVPFRRHWWSKHEVDLNHLASQLHTQNYKSKTVNRKMVLLRMLPVFNQLHRYYAVDMVHGYMNVMGDSEQFLRDLETTTGMRPHEVVEYIQNLRDTTVTELKKALKAIARGFVTMEQIYGEAGFELPEISVVEHIKEMHIKPFDEVMRLKATPATPRTTVSIPVWSTSDTFVPHNHP